MTTRDTVHLNVQFATRRLCAASGKLTGLWEIPKRRRRCLLCNRLVRIVDDGRGDLVISRHYVYPGRDERKAR